VAIVIVAIAAVALSITAPLRPISGDTVPGRIGAAVLRCAGTFDLRRLDWVQQAADRSSTYYYMYPDKTDEYTSVFGPVPALVGTLALLDFGEGDRIADADLRARERYAAAFLVALAAAMLVLAAGARSSPVRAGLTGFVAVASYAGAATLGQGLWQATTALPFLTGALALLAWRDRSSRLALLAGLATPTLLVLAAMLRPTIAPLCGGLGLVWLLHARPRTRRGWIVAIAVVLAASAPLVVYNAIHLYSPFPIAQWKVNKLLNQGSPFSIGHAATGVAGLVASPGRGLVWFAPIIVVGVVRGLRRGDSEVGGPWRFAAIGVLLQLLAMALFFKWHGGLAFGPRLLAEATWVATFLALGTSVSTKASIKESIATPWTPAARYLVGAAAVLTCVVGLTGLYGWRPEQWELRRIPEVDASALWDFVDSPLTAIFVDHGPRPPARDVPPTDGMECRSDGTLRSF
jgi:hypothetical protein